MTLAKIESQTLNQPSHPGVPPWDFFICKTISSVNRDCFTSLPICLFFFFFFSLARIYSIRLKRSGKNGYLLSCSRSLEESNQSSTIMDNIGFGIFVEALCETEEAPFHPNCIDYFDHNRVLDCVKCFFLFQQDDHVVLVL